VQAKDIYNDTLVDKIATQYFKRLVNWKVSTELDFVQLDKKKKLGIGFPTTSHKISRAPVRHMLAKLEIEQDRAKVRVRPSTVENTLQSKVRWSDKAQTNFNKTVPRGAKLQIEGWESPGDSQKCQSILFSRPYTSVPGSPNSHSPAKFSFTMPRESPYVEKVVPGSIEPLARKLRRLLFRSPSMQPEHRDMMIIGVSSPLA